MHEQVARESSEYPTATGRGAAKPAASMTGTATGRKVSEVLHGMHPFLRFFIEGCAKWVKVSGEFQQLIHLCVA